MRVGRLLWNLLVAVLMPLLVAAVGWYYCSIDYFNRAAKEWSE